jgi:ubiquinone/menaquinone biosynthesis C-methylase UbiE
MMLYTGPEHQDHRAATVHHPLFSRLRPLLVRRADERGMAERRARMLGGLQGRVIEVGAGTGATFRHYPPTVREVLAVEPEPALRRLATEAAAKAPVAVHVIDGVAEKLPAQDCVFDAAVVCNILCSVGELAVAAAELHRVVRPGGVLRFNEHVISERQAVARLQRTADATIWPWLSGGCHLGRDTLAELRRAGFVVECCERTSGVRAVGPPKSYVLGSAHRPSEPAVAPPRA